MTARNWFTNAFNRSGNTANSHSVSLPPTMMGQEAQRVVFGDLEADNGSRCRQVPPAGWLVTRSMTGVGRAGFRRPNSEVIFNGQALCEAELAAVEQTSGKKFVPGSYWYDRVSGIWGSEGNGPRGRVAAHLELGGPLQEDASHGHTDVCLNGRRLGWLELSRIRGFMTLPAGRYWQDAADNFGLEGGATMGNFRLLAIQANQASLFAITAGTAANDENVTVC